MYVRGSELYSFLSPSLSRSPSLLFMSRPLSYCTRMSIVRQAFFSSLSPPFPCSTAYCLAISLSLCLSSTDSSSMTWYITVRII